MKQNAERNYKKLAEKNRDPVISFAKLPAEHGLQTQYQQIKDLWNDTADKMITAQNEAEVELLWREMQQEIQKLGIYDIEAALTGLYQDALARYQAAGFFTE